MENQALTPPPVPESRHRTGPRWNRIFTSAAIAILAVLAWQSHETRLELHGMQGEIAHRMADGSKDAQEARTLARQGQENIDAIQSKIGALESRMEDARGQYASLEALYADLSRARDERVLVEIEQAVNIAAQQLQLAGNVSGAMAALQAADSRLALLDQTRFLPLRKLIAADLERLKALPLSDISSVALQLETIMGRVNSLPLGFEHSPVASSAKGAKTLAKEGKPSAASAPVAAASTPGAEPGLLARFGRDMWDEFRQLIRIERLDQPDAALLAPSQATYLRENLRLRLLSARLALLQREGKLFAEDVHQARDLLQRFFDISARPVADTLSELTQIEQARLTMNLPSLEQTQAALRGLKLGGKH